MIELRPEISPATLVNVLRESALSLKGVVGKGSHVLTMRTDYLTWAAQAARRLGSFVPRAEVDRLVTTPRCLLIHTSVADGGSEALRTLLDAEVEERDVAFQDAIEYLQSEIESWGNGRAVVAFLDSNILLHHFDQLLTEPWAETLGDDDAPVVLAIAMKVIDELDNLKDRGNKDVQPKARQALRWIETAIKKPKRAEVLRRPDFLADETGLWLKVVLDGLDHEPLPVADAEIVSRALSVASFAQATAVVSNDTGMILRARAAGLRAVRMRWARDNAVTTDE